MSKKFSIIKTVDLDKLDEEIERYIYEANENNPYIFMSDDTANAIAEEVMPIDDFSNLNINSDKRLNGINAEYCGYKIFINDKLKFGDIELR